MGISAVVQDVLDEIHKCFKNNDLKSINYKMKIESKIELNFNWILKINISVKY